MRACNCTLPYINPDACSNCQNRSTFDEYKFLNDFIEQQEPLPPEFQKVLDDNFWELLEE